MSSNAGLYHPFTEFREGSCTNSEAAFSIAAVIFPAALLAYTIHTEERAKAIVEQLFGDREIFLYYLLSLQRLSSRNKAVLAKSMGCEQQILL